MNSKQCFLISCIGAVCAVLIVVMGAVVPKLTCAILDVQDN